MKLFRTLQVCKVVKKDIVINAKINSLLNHIGMHTYILLVYDNMAIVGKVEIRNKKIIQDNYAI